ncbi:MAG: hypothetical protein AAGF15_04250 [Pseudomonadota bacterium]
MSLYMNTKVNRVDKKGRVSVPAIYRSRIEALDNPFKGVVLSRSDEEQCIVGYDMAYIQQSIETLKNATFDKTSGPGPFTPKWFRDIADLQFDPNGRIIIPAKFREFANINDRAVFSGCGYYFQIWNPEAYIASGGILDEELCE